jgi:hypothetical protein
MVLVRNHQWFLTVFEKCMFKMLVWQFPASKISEKKENIT